MTRPVDVLLVEDNASDAELVVECLRAVGLAGAVHTVTDGEAALDFLFARGPYATQAGNPLPLVMFLDIKLPKVDGFEVLRAVRADPRTRALPVVMLTSSLVERDVARCYALGANSYVQKPLDFDQFRPAIQRLGEYWIRVNAAVPPAAFEARR